MRKFAVVAIYLLASLSSAVGQSTFGSIVGVVHDKTDALVPGATVQIKDLGDNSTRSMTSDQNGSFEFVNLKPSRYEVSVHADGFTDFRVPSTELTARQALRVDVTLNIKSQSETIEVADTVAVVNTENAVIGDSKNNAQIGQLPLNFRAVTTSPLAALATSANVQQDSQGNIALAGATANMVGYSVDGISTANIFQSTASTNPYPSSEGIAELKVTAFNNSAEFSQVGDVTFTTKGGTNDWHGSLFEYLQNDALDARILNFTSKAPKHFNTFGGSFGGPVQVPHLYNGKNRTFFFVDYEGNRKRTSQPEQYLVPTAAERTGNLSDLGGGAVTSLNASSLALLHDYYPLPNINCIAQLTSNCSFNYENLQPIPSSTNGIDGRIDQIINSKQQAYARFNWKNLVTNVVNPLLPNDLDHEHDRSFLVSHNFTLRKNLLNEFRFGFTNSLLAPNFPIEGAAAISQLGLLDVDVSNHPYDGGFPSINFSQGTGFTPIGRDHVGNTYSSTKQIADNLTYIRGKHTFRGGIDFRWVRFGVPEIETPSDDYGLFTFTGALTGNTFGDFLQGLPDTTYFAVTGPRDNAGGPQMGLYAQDEWQVNSRLTVNAGLRWEWLPPFVDRNGIQANFDPLKNAVIVNSVLYNKLGGPVPAFLQSFNACNAAPAGFAAPADQGYVPSTSMPCTAVVSNGQEGLPPGLRQTYLRNLDPRISFAFRPFNDNKTVLRAGFGIFTVINLGQLQNNNESNPQAAVHTYQNAISNGVPLFQFPNTIAPSQLVQIGGGTLEQATDPRYRDPQSAQWNVTVERELTPATALRVSYVGMNSYRLNLSVNWNQIAPSTQPYVPSPFVDPRAPFQNWGVIYSTENLGGANYQAMEVEATHRTSKGLSFSANYTWAHNISDAQGDAPVGFGGETAYGLSLLDRFAIRQDRGNVAGTRRQRFLLTGNYDLPFGKGRQWSSSSGVLNGIFGGWSLNTITLIETGPYLTPTINPSGCQVPLNSSGQCPTLNGIPETNDQTNTDPELAGSILRPDIVGNPIPAQRSASNYFNINAFAPTPVGAGRIGNAGVGILEGPGTIAVSAGLARAVTIREHFRLRFEATFTNVLNHTNYAPPATNVSSPSTFGVLDAQQTAENAGNRTGQLALRLDF
jgi:Carboxypeptidase regulatory-like domain/TonB dependent receptor